MDSKFIYHYTKLTTAIDYILPQRQLLLNFMAHSNDPREYKKFMFAASYWFNNSRINREKQDETNSKILRDDCKFISFSRNYKDYFGFEYSNMWAHYGDLHQGICLKIDKEKFESENRAIIKKELFKEITYFELDLRKSFYHPEVQYPINPSEYELKIYLRNKFRYENIDFLYFMKREEWFSEHEVRLVIFSENHENEYCSIQDSLSGIILGLDFDSKNDLLIFNVAQNVPVYKIDYTGDRIVKNKYKPAPI